MLSPHNPSHCPDWGFLFGIVEPKVTILMSSTVKIIIFTPLTHTDVVRQAMGEAGAGIIGNYTHCSFSSRGHGRFIPQPGAEPAIGTVGSPEVVEEDRIETICHKDKVKAVLAAVRAVHPYDELAFDIVPLLDENEL
jgi:hypothetical protein